jgi:hypothetical protein
VADGLREELEGLNARRRGRHRTTDFDRIFDARYTATDLFTNRVGENAALVNALLSHAERVIDGTAALAGVERRNVLTFSGIGGIGKTEL